MTIIWISVTSIIFIVIINSFMSYPFNPFMFLVFSWSIHIFGYIVAIDFLLIHTCYAVYLIEKRLLIRDTNHINYEDLKQKLLIIQKYKESINSHLGIFPFLWFCEMFSSTCFRLTLVVVNRHKPKTFYHDNDLGLIIYVFIVLCNLCYMVIINYST